MLTCRWEGAPGAPVVLWLHGFMGAGADWDEIARSLGPTHRSLLVDLPGHGGSLALAPDAYSMEGAVGAVAEVLDAEEVDRCALVGYSMGGRVALSFALRYPDRCSRLVLESASPGLETAAEREARSGVDEERARRIEREGMSRFVEAWYRQPLFASMASHAGLVEAQVRARSANDPHEAARALRGLSTGRQPSLWERLEGLRVSTLALAGALDGKYVEIARRMAVLNPRIRAAILPKAGHNVHAELPEAFATLVEDFLRQP